MKNIECTFYRPNTIIIKELRNIVDKLEIDFHSICSGEVGKEDLVSVDASQYDICVSDIKCEQHGSSFLYGFPVLLKERHCRRAPGQLRLGTVMKLPGHVPRGNSSLMPFQAIAMSTC